MSYLVKAVTDATGPISQQQVVNWRAGDERWVDNECVWFYNEHTDVFTVLIGPTVNDEPSFGKMSVAYLDFNGTAEDAMKVTINGVIYQEADVAVPASGVWTNGASAANSAASLIAAINGDTRATVPFKAVADVSGDGVWLFWKSIGSAGNITITTDSASKCTVQNSTGGEDHTFKSCVRIKHTVNTQELLSGAVEIPVPFVPTGFHAQAFSSTGGRVLFTDLVTIQATPSRIRIATNGATNLANTDVLFLVVWE